MKDVGNVLSDMIQSRALYPEQQRAMAKKNDLESLSSKAMSGPEEPQSNKRFTRGTTSLDVVSPKWKHKAKMPKYENVHMDNKENDSDSSTQSVDNELGVPITRTLRI